MKTFSNLLIITLMFALSSCLTSGLEDLPEFEYADITGVQKVEYRYISNEISTTDNQPIVKYVNLPRVTKIDKETRTVTLEVTVPAANASSFPESERIKVSTSELCVMVTISTAAKITPLNGSPLLGVPGDWSKTNEYRVLAADGRVKDWKIQITKLTK